MNSMQVCRHSWARAFSSKGARLQPRSPQMGHFNPPPLHRNLCAVSTLSSLHTRQPSEMGQMPGDARPVRPRQRPAPLTALETYGSQSSGARPRHGRRGSEATSLGPCPQLPQSCPVPATTSTPEPSTGRAAPHHVELIQAQSVDARPLAVHGLPECLKEQVL